MPGRNAQVARIYTILNLLEGTPQGLSAKEIRARAIERGHEASQRTIYRDLEALSASGFPLFPQGEGSTDSPATRWVLEKTARIDRYLVLTPRELVGLYLSRSVLAPLRDTPFYEDLERMFGKIEEKLGTRANEHLRDLSNEIRFEPGPRWGLGVNPDLLDTVRAACTEGQLMACTYASVSSDGPTPRTLGPHYLYFSKGALYLVAEDLGDGKIKTFALPRMSDARMLDDAYQGSKSDPAELFRNSFGIYRDGGAPEDVTIHFSRTIAPFVRERSWHHSQRTVAKSGGDIELKLHVTITPELVSWILGFGPEATVLEPRHLQSRLAEAAERIIGKYRPAVRAAA